MKNLADHVLSNNQVVENDLEMNVLLNNEYYSSQKLYWMSRLKSVDTLDTFSSHSQSTISNTKEYVFSIDASVSDRLTKICKGSDLSVYITLISAAAVIVSKYVQNNAVAIYSPVFKPKVTSRTLNQKVLIHAKIGEEESYKNLILASRKSVLEAYENQDYPIQKILNSLNSQGPGITCWFENIHGAFIRQEDSEDICLVFNLKNNRIEGYVNTNQPNVDPILAKGIVKYFPMVLQHMLNNVNATVSSLELLKDQERFDVLNTFNDTDLMLPKFTSVIEMFYDAVKQSPHKIALTSKNMSFTYQELDEESNQIANWLIDKNVGKGDVVGLFLPRSKELILAILAVLKAGAAYVPIDTNLPANRINFITKDSGAKIVIANSAYKKTPDLPTSVLYIDKVNTDNYSKNASGVTTLESDLAYLIYTSGTTGNPKGVMIGHNSLVNYVYWASSVYIDEAPIVCPLFTSISFDLTITSIFLPLTTGNQLMIFEEEDTIYNLQKIFNTPLINFVKMTPSHLSMVENLEIENVSDNPKTFVLGGEILDTTLASAIEDKFHHKVRIFNEYGPTEATIGCMVHKFDRAVDQQRGVSIGRPIANTQIYLLDNHLKPVPAGIEGEIYIGGKGLAKGYVGNNALTMSRFLASPFTPNTKIYKTGDKAVWDVNGKIKFLGRSDRQIKLRGHRIELQEIEEQLLQHDNVKAAISVVKKLSEKEVICAYVQLKDKAMTTNLEEYLQQQLPSYMVPGFITVLTNFPLTINGKVEIDQLPNPVRCKTTPYVSAQTTTEVLLQQCWSGVLGDEKLGVLDNFFHIGGDSIMSLQITAQLNSLGINIEVNDIFKFPTIVELAQYIDERKLNSGRGGASSKATTHEHITIAPEIKESINNLFDDVEDIYPLSPLQNGILIHAVSNKSSAAYFEQVSYRVAGTLDTSVFKLSISHLVERNKILRTAFVYEGLSQPLQVVLKNRAVIINSYDFSNHPLDAIEAEIEGIRVNDRSTNFDLSKDVLIRFSIIRLPNNQYEIILNSHHILMDGWCSGILMLEFFKIYEAIASGNPVQLPNPIPYKNYISWLSNQDRSKALAYWNEKLSGYDEICSLPSRLEKVGYIDQNYASLEFSLDRSIIDKLSLFTKEYNVTPNSFLQTLWGVLVGRYNDTEDVVFGTVVSGRPADLPGVNQILGLFSNTIPMRINIGKGQSLLAEMKKTQESILGDAVNHHVSLAEIQNNQKTKNSLFDHIFVFENFPTIKPIENKTNDGLDLALLNTTSFSRSDFNFSISVFPKDGYRIAIEYNANVFDKSIIESLIRHYKNCIAQALNNPHLQIEDIDILCNEERHKILNVFNDTDEIFKSKLSIIKQIENQAKKSPKKIAVHAGDKGISYFELNGKANDLAKQLVKLGVTRNQLIPLFTVKSEALPIAYLAILKAGAAFVPVDPTWPEERIKLVLEDIASELILLPKIEDEFVGLQHIRLLPIDSDTLKVDPKNLGIYNGKDEPIYAIYTSGSTGAPKAAINLHKGINNRLNHMTKRYKPVDDDVILATTEPIYDSFVWQLLWPLTFGGKSIIPNQGVGESLGRFLDLIENFKVSIIDFTPAVFSGIMKLMEGKVSIKSKLRTLRQLIIGGEAIKPSDVNVFRNHFPKVGITNAYGPTEASIGTIFYDIGSEPINLIPIGKPIDNVKVLILDKKQRLMPIGSAGELYLGGDCVGLGYLNNQQKTTAAFNQLSHFGAPSLFYKTGDKASYLANGNIVYLGRKDDQIKIRGHRIELREIEYQLKKHPEILEVVVTVTVHPIRGQKQITAYFISEVEIKEESLREHLVKLLPSYMLPSNFIKIDKIPIAKSGKIDQSTLNHLYQSSIKTKTFVSPRNSTETKVAKFWEEVLSLSQIGINENFFDLGGNSLDLLLLQEKYFQAFGVADTIVAMLTYPTIKSFSTYLDHNSFEEKSLDRSTQLAQGKQAKMNRRNRRKRTVTA